jgi:small subunit ribosomal protein S21
VPAAVFVDTGRHQVCPDVTERTQMIKIKSRGNETAEQMIRRFKKMCEKEGLTKDIKRVAYYEKPSEKRRRRIRSKPRLKPVGR